MRVPGIDIRIMKKYILFGYLVMKYGRNNEIYKERDIGEKLIDSENNGRILGIFVAEWRPKRKNTAIRFGDARILNAHHTNHKNE